MASKWFVGGCVQAALAVVLGAFGAHALEGVMTAEAAGTYETGSRYHMLHALALFVTAWAIAGGRRPRLARAAGWLFHIGIVLFAGSLYVLAPTGIRWLGAITPLGGVSFIAGWVLLALSCIKMENNGKPRSRNSESMVN